MSLNAKLVLTDGRRDVRPENIMRSAYCCWRRHKNKQNSGSIGQRTDRFLTDRRQYAQPVKTTRNKEQSLLTVLNMNIQNSYCDRWNSLDLK